MVNKLVNCDISCTRCLITASLLFSQTAIFCSSVLTPIFMNKRGIWIIIILDSIRQALLHLPFLASTTEIVLFKNINILAEFNKNEM